MSRIKSNYNFRNTARFAYWENSTKEIIGFIFPIAYYDDFLGAGIVIPAAAAAESGVDWVKKITGAAPPTVGILANGAGGILELAMTNADQKQEAGAYFDDQKTFDVTKNLIWETRVKLSVLPTGNGEMQWGLASNYAEDISNVTYKMGFDVDGNGELNCIIDDNSSDQSSSTGRVITASDWHIYRFECTDVNDIKFFLDGEDICSTTKFQYTETGANAVLQPYFYCYKASGTGVGTMQVDYVKIWSSR